MPRPLPSSLLTEWIKRGCALWCESILATFRSDHTLIGFIAPPEEEGALTEMQITQIFWSALAWDLVKGARPFYVHAGGKTSVSILGTSQHAALLCQRCPDSFDLLETVLTRTPVAVARPSAPYRSSSTASSIPAPSRTSTNPSRCCPP